MLNMGFKLFFIGKECCLPQPEGPPSDWGLKAGKAKCHFTRKHCESRAFTDIFYGFTQIIECRYLTLLEEGDTIGQKRKMEYITIKLHKSQFDSLKKYAASKHLSMVDVVRAFTRKGMSVEA
jgi:hypothetical protein